MKNKITLLVLAGFFVLIVGVAGIRKIVLRKNRAEKLRQIHPKVVFILASSDLTRLHKAALDNDAPRTKALIEQGWAVDRQVRGKLTPLHVASVSGSSESAAVLVQYGADIDYENSEGLTPLAFAAIGAKRGMIEFLLASGASPDKKNRNGLTPADAAQKWREKTASPWLSLDKTYEDEMNACIELLKQAAERPARGDSNTKGKVDD